MILPPVFRRQSTKLIGARRSALDIARGRLVVGGILFSLCYIIAAARLIDLTLIQGEFTRFGHNQSVETGGTASRQQTALRGDIYDRNGVLLARSLETASLFANPALITDPEQVARDVVKALPGLKYGEVLQKLQKGGRFVWLKRNLTPQEQYAVLTLGHPGLDFQQESHRIYPQGELAAHIVGKTNIDGKGQNGVERSFNNYLESGAQALRLTIDIRLQYILRRELARAIREFDGIGGGAAIMDVNTGEVLAAVSAPDFDPHRITAKNMDAQFNRLVGGSYEMGSTFKIFSTAAYLESKNPPMGQQFDAREPIKIGGFSISDFHPEDRFLTIPEIFMHSSNIGAARIAEAMGAKVLKDFYKDLGLLDPLQIELDEVARPQIPDPWRDINTLTASYGHGIAVTPMQTLAATATIANGGILIHPTLVMDNNTKEKASKTETRVISAETAHRMRQMMRLVVSDGTATAADVLGFQVGGKTGTAQKGSAGKGYDRNKRLSSFIGVFPMDAPRYAILMMVDEPKGTKASYGYATGGWVAAPAVGRVIAAMAPVLGLVPKEIDPEKDMAAPLRAYIKDGETEKHLASFGTE